jgi:hypothetical protein
MHHSEIRDTLAEVSRAERQLVILEPDNCRFFATLLGDHCGKGSIDVLIMVPVARFKDGPLELEVTQGPQGAIGKA